METDTVAIDFNIDNEKDRHKKALANIQHQKDSEQDRYDKTIQALKQQKQNVINQRKNGYKEDFDNNYIERLNCKFEIAFKEIDEIKAIIIDNIL